MANQIAAKLRQAGFELEESNVAELASMLLIAADEIDRLDPPRPAPRVDIYSHPKCVHVYCSMPDICKELPDGCAVVKHDRESGRAE